LDSLFLLILRIRGFETLVMTGLVRIDE
jgi:hypothetical protein